MKRKDVVDFTVENHGSIFLLRPLTSAAQTWVDGIQGDALEVR